MRDATLCTIHPTISEEGYTALTVPTHRASTIVFPDAAAYATRGQRDLDGFSYGLHGTPTNRVLEAQLTALEGGRHTVLVPSGQTAIAVIFLAMLKPGDTVLIPDSAYPPVTGFCRNFLAPLGIGHRVYRPDASDLEAQIDSSVKLIWMEAPGSTTMEVQDVPAIVALAKRHGILTGIDNTWATPLLFKPLAHGVDFSMQALTKYVGGHSDLLMGSVSVNDSELRRRLRDQMRMLGLGVPPDAVSLALRGIETMAVRMAHQGRVALELARELADRGVGEVLHPALPSCPGHEIFKRDFAGASGVFSIVLPEAARLNPALDALRVFAIGASWGGTRSLMAPMTITRENAHPRNDKTILRLQIGLEDPADLRADLEAFFDILTTEQADA
ncbi:trans-sulfuration enzyme family protein [Falsirhodobacter sp. 20TX0035]|uniref:trans-sulfuration enzyme family protein n=1 Tax=Falsirhodobacter sp. 20TX0035 TaxID=3022019 RepID=UPI00232FE022|nr:aminotransferase class I/II-fold pyridoxal phosphate-dependent enzyme [Falsirhodobacter sp. 20TX0035]MDB6454228.1 aminotransferase class I/II-fold pyridoxal phosphate-dependent enzyme [Falsirhodobacter sp. 20TX0035]